MKNKVERIKEDKENEEMNKKIKDFFKKYEKTLIPVMKRLSKR